MEREQQREEEQNRRDENERSEERMSVEETVEACPLETEIQRRRRKRGGRNGRYVTFVNAEL